MTDALMTRRTAPSYKGLRPASDRASAAAKGSSRKADTKHERLLRGELWRAGCRFRKNLAGLPGKPDIAFTRVKLAVFCDGDFWHGRDWEQRKAKLEGGSNPAYWVKKIERNIERDGENTRLLMDAGWSVMRVWESDILANPQEIARLIIRELNDRGHFRAMNITYSIDRSISTEQFISVLRRSTLGDRRPIDDLQCISGMLSNSNLLVSAWHDDLLVGVSRSVTDFNYCCYLSDLAVDTEYQHRGIGLELQRLTQEQLGPKCKIILLAAPAASGYYPQIGYQKHESCWILARDRSLISKRSKSAKIRS